MEKEREAGASVADEAAGAVEDLEAEIAAVRLAASKQVADARREASAAAESAAASRYHYSPLPGEVSEGKRFGK